MVAPTRTPQARGVKCELCKKILSAATWLDQTKLAKNVEEAEYVINLLDKHSSSDCPCIPRNIGNLLLGSTHFEVHRLVAKKLDDSVHKKQYEIYLDARKRLIKDTSKNKNKIINDCEDINRSSRFNLHSNHYEDTRNGIAECSSKHLKHLVKAIEYWKKAMEDTASPFNAKLALRLGLTHHVIYACYLFKYYKLLEYQLITANLLLNLFRSIEGVTANAILHANYLLVISFLDCGYIHLARQHLKTVTKTSNYSDKTHYESILLTSISCELELINCGSALDNLDLLASLAKIQPDDKLQHYYARTLALSTIIKYIHNFPARSDLCFEFYHTFRYMSAIIRRCYESSFDLVLFEKSGDQSSHKAEPKKNQIVDHSWIRFALCDFVFSTFDLCSNFYLKSGQPENLQLLYNGLNLIAHRSGSFYWQARIAILGAQLDLLCDKTEHGLTKLDIAADVINYSSDNQVTSLMDLDLEVTRLDFDLMKHNTIDKARALELLQKIKTFQSVSSEILSKIDIYDCGTLTYTSMNEFYGDDLKNIVVLNNSIISQVSLRCLKILITSMMRSGDPETVKELLVALSNQLKLIESKTLPYYDCQLLLEILILYAGVESSDELLIDTVQSTNLIIDFEDTMQDINSQLSNLTLQNDKDKTPKAKRKTKTSKSKMTFVKYCKRKRTYHVASLSEENLNETGSVRFFDTIEAFKSFESLTNEEIVACYLRNSEPNPDYLLYRKAHELMFCYRLKDDNHNLEQLLFHFCESSTSNTMRYRWMMFEEHHSSPYEQSTVTRQTNSLKYLGFNNTLSNIENTAKSMIRSLPDDFKLVQLKYIFDERNRIEHILIVSIDKLNDPMFFHTKKSLGTDDFFEDAKTPDSRSLSLPFKFKQKVEEAKATLFYTNQLLKSEKRDELEKDIGLLLSNFEDECLGPFRIVICGKTSDSNYSAFIQESVAEIESTINHQCISREALKLIIENAPLLNRDEILRLLSIVFDCRASFNELVACYNSWYKSFNQFVKVCNPNQDRIVYFESLTRGQIGLILDKDLEHLPFESLPISRTRRQGVFRVPSLRLFSIIANQHPTSTSFIDCRETAYILDPANNLEKTRERFKSKLISQKMWTGTIGKPPKTDILEEWLTSKQIYIFIGHGAGTTYYNRLCKSRGLSLMPRVNSTSIVMGCSSGRVSAEGPKLESFGICWVFVFRGAPAYLGLLWDVTDTDIDKFLDSLLSKWLGSKWAHQEKGMEESRSISAKSVALTDAVAQVRQVCRLKFLIGSTPVVYGLPVWSKS